MQNYCFCQLSMQILCGRCCSRVVDLELPRIFWARGRIPCATRMWRHNCPPDRKPKKPSELWLAFTGLWWPRGAIRVFGVFSTFSFYIIFHFTYLVYFIGCISFRSFYFILFRFQKQFIIEVKWNQGKNVCVKCNLIQSKINWKQMNIKAT